VPRDYRGHPSEAACAPPPCRDKSNCESRELGEYNCPAVAIMDLCAFGDRAAALSPARRLFDPPGQFFVTLRDFAHHPTSLGVLHGFGSGQDFLGAVSRLPCEEQKPFGYCWHWRPPTAAKKLQPPAEKVLRWNEKAAWAEANGCAAMIEEISER